MAAPSWWAVLFTRPQPGEGFRSRAMTFCAAFGVVLLLKGLWQPHNEALVWIGAVFISASLLQQVLWIRKRRSAKWTRGSDVRV
jgi:hypothetical protein